MIQLCQFKRKKKTKNLKGQQSKKDFRFLLINLYFSISLLRVLKASITEGYMGIIRRNIVEKNQR